MKRLNFGSFLWIYFCCIYGTTLITKTQAWEICSAETGGGICPDGNTCCLMDDNDDDDGSSGCIASDMGKFNGVCCGDGRTACAEGYSCRPQGDCAVSDGSPLTDPLVSILPRYRLCHADGIDDIQGLSIVPGAELAYYSSHGPVENITDKEIEMAFIFLHGSGRNGDDYFCSGRAIVDLQDKYDNVLLIAPRFYAETDEREGRQFLFWEDNGAGPWRYGADAVEPAAVSSYTCMDYLVDAIWKHLPHIEKLAVTGHSAGGQFVQRWTLLTSKWVPGRMHSVVANPSSYAYLTPLRYIDGDWALPGVDENCANYNQWEWGLDDGGDTEVPYRNEALTNVTEVIERFRDRPVVYLVGGRDRCNVTVAGWCHSHGLEAHCMEELQGKNRFERSARYVSSLRMLGFWENHIRHVVPNVGHDHSLMFESPVGLDAVFGDVNFSDFDDQF